MTTTQAMPRIDCIEALEGKPDLDMAMKRIEAWYAGEMIDRPPVRFSRHNAEYDVVHESSRWACLKDRWFDAEYQLETFLASIEGKTFHGETFPIFWPNLGPNVYAAFYAGTIEFGEVTSWIDHVIHDPQDVEHLHFDPETNVYFKWLEDTTRMALERCQGKFWVGYTDLHPGMDCVADWRGSETLCTDFYDHPDMVQQLIDLATKDFEWIFRHFDAMLQAHNQPSCTWMGIPSLNAMHIPSCDFSNLVSPRIFKKYCLPITQKEVTQNPHNIYHLDGKGVARHIDSLLRIPEIQAIQWVQGVGDDQAIMQWLPFIKKIQAAGKGVVVDLLLDELEPFIREMDPQGLFLCIPAKDENEELDILRRVTAW